GCHAGRHWSRLRARPNLFQTRRRQKCLNGLRTWLTRQPPWQPCRCGWVNLARSSLLSLIRGLTVYHAGYVAVKKEEIPFPASERHIERKLQKISITFDLPPAGDTFEGNLRRGSRGLLVRDPTLPYRAACSNTYYTQAQTPLLS